MKKHLIFFSYLYFLLCFFSCQKEATKQWICIQNKDLYIWSNTNAQGYSYHWKGDSFDKLIHGAGLLSTYRNDSLITQKTIVAHYGTIDTNDVTTLSDGSLYIGKIQEGLFEGFGVYLKGQDLYIGTFVKSKPNGTLNWYKNGVLYYSGEWQDGNFQGKGTLWKEDGSIKKGTWDNGKLVQTYCKEQTCEGFYEGYVLNGKPDGIGTMCYKNNSCYTGEWSNGMWEGKGTFISSKDSINGEWIAGKLNGYVICKNEKYKYEGTCKDNVPEGIGSICLEDSSIYSGEWIAGKRCGYGEMTFSNSDIYLGEWVDNRFDGIGKYIFSGTNEYYDGEWKKGLRHGSGTYVSVNFQYIGDWEEGGINGEGYITYPNGDFYEGNFVENKYYGIGYYQFKNGNSYEGEFIDGKFNGLGIFRFADGSIYEGEFQNGKIKGDGTLYYIEEGDTIAFTAYWNGTNLFPKHASVLFSNGDLYEGELVNGFPTAKGVWTTEGERFKNIDIARNDIKRVNEFYKKHKDAWNKFVNYTSIALTVVEVAAPVVSTILLVTPAAPAAGALIAIGKGAAVANITLNAADAAIASTFLGIDIYEYYQKGEDAIETVTTLGSEIAVNAALMATPKALKKIPAKKMAVGLSTVAENAMRKSVITLNRNKAFGKVIYITKEKSGILTKKVSNIKKRTIPIRKFQSIYLASKLAKTTIMKDLQDIIKKGPIKLSNKELVDLCTNPQYYRKYVETYTGNKNNFQEFFIRLSMADKNQVSRILAVPEIRSKVDRSIRQSGEGGVHEWLMTKNFIDFLTNPKWGDDGKLLVLALTQLVQRTKTVAFKNGGTHFSKENSGRFHRELAEVIARCSTKEELFLEIKKYAKESLTKESYNEFSQIFSNIFNTSKIII